LGWHWTPDNNIVSQFKAGHPLTEKHGFV
jgi:hypothetical protein